MDVEQVKAALYEAHIAPWSKSYRAAVAWAEGDNAVKIARLLGTTRSSAVAHLSYCRKRGVPLPYADTIQRDSRRERVVCYLDQYAMMQMTALAEQRGTTVHRLARDVLDILADDPTLLANILDED